jgi:hypothetical protein
MADDPNYEKEFLDEIFADVIKLDYILLKTEHFPQLSVFTRSDEDSRKIRVFYELAKKFTKEGVLHGFGLFGDGTRRWVETKVIPQDFIDFYSIGRSEKKEIGVSHSEGQRKEPELIVKLHAGLFTYKNDERIYFNNNAIEDLEMREFRILLALIKEANMMVPYEKLAIEASSKGDPISEPSLQKYKSTLQEKLKAVIRKEDKKFSGKIITAVQNNGYRLEAKRIQEFFSKK